MSTYQPNVNPSSPEGQALQASIQKQLALLDWSTEEDATMAEYCLVMLGNRKTAEQISGELSDLIGGDFDPSFVTWLFDEVKNHYPEPAPAPTPSAAQPSTSSSSSSAPSSGLPARPTQPGRMFGAAVSGVKRDSREMSEGGREQPPHQRQRFDRDGAPSGPRNGANGSGGKSLFDRMGGAKNAQFAPGARNNTPLINNLGMPQAAFDAITQTIQAVNSGAHPSTLATIPFPALAAHPLSSTLPPPVLAQAQAHAMAQAQAFAQMQNVWNSSAGGFGPAQSGFNPQAAPFHPAFGQMQQPQNGGFRGGPPGQPGQQQQQFQAPQQQQRPKPPVVLPKKPELEAICKHGVECTKPTCGFSHPSPVATKESGLVLSSEACDKQLSCQDLDCPKSHVSPSQKNASSSSSSNPVPSTTSVSAPPPPSATSTPADPTSIPGAGTKPCKFGSSCTRVGCVFMHPWDVRGDPNGGTVPCRYGSACTRSDCHFSHPPKHAQQYQRSKFSATFNSSSASASPKPSTSSTNNPKATIGDWPKENPTHVSERLKRFAVNGDHEGGGEKIIPGQQQGQNGNGNGNEKEDKVEIHLDDDQDEQKEKGASSSSPVKETTTAAAGGTTA